MFSPLTPVFSLLERLTETEKQWIRAAGRLHNPYSRACIAERCFCLHSLARPPPSGLSSRPVHHEGLSLCTKSSSRRECGISEGCFYLFFFSCILIYLKRIGNAAISSLYCTNLWLVFVSNDKICIFFLYCSH
jgi:hypothetical protein